MKVFLKSILVLAVLGGIVFGYVHEVPYFSNTFDMQFLFFRALGVGALIGALLGWYFSKNVADKSDRVPVFMLCLVTCMAILPLKASFINHFMAKNDPLSTKVVFQEEKALRTTRIGVVKGAKVTVDAFYVSFIRNGKLDRIRTQNASFKGIEKGQEIELSIKKGFLGFDFVEIP